jgi:hypothetical protein
MDGGRQNSRERKSLLRNNKTLAGRQVLRQNTHWHSFCSANTCLSTPRDVDAERYHITTYLTTISTSTEVNFTLLLLFSFSSLMRYLRLVRQSTIIQTTLYLPCCLSPCPSRSRVESPCLQAGRPLRRTSAQLSSAGATC